MEIIVNANDFYVNILGVNPVNLKTLYRFNKLIISIDIDDGKVMLNGLTRTIVFINNYELDNLQDINTSAFLYRAYFLIPENFGEISETNKIREKIRPPADDLYLNESNRFTILPTLKCNARYKYCYE